MFHSSNHSRQAFLLWCKHIFQYVPYSCNHLPPLSTFLNLLFCDPSPTLYLSCMQLSSPLHPFYINLFFNHSPFLFPLLLWSLYLLIQSLFSLSLFSSLLWSFIIFFFLYLLFSIYKFFLFHTISYWSFRYVSFLSSIYLSSHTISFYFYLTYLLLIPLSYTLFGK